jgi:hypothetical protein
LIKRGGEVELSLVALASEGHILIEDVPGVGGLYWAGRHAHPSAAPSADSVHLIFQRRARALKIYNQRPTRVFQVSPPFVAAPVWYGGRG